MVTAEEAIRALKGVALIARFDRTGFLAFGHEYRDCARSFWAYVLGLPAYAVILGILTAYGTPQSDHPAIAVLAQLVAYVVSAVALPLVLLPLLRQWRRDAFWAWFVTAYNWVNLGQLVVLAAVLILRIGPLADLGAVADVVSRVFFIVLECFMVHTMLQVGPLRSVAVVLLDLGLGIALDDVASLVAG